LGTAAERAGKRAAKLDNFDFEELSEQDNRVVPLSRPDKRP
jgi:DNA recombination protein RmuC